jgi:hypothetical protein
MARHQLYRFAPGGGLPPSSYCFFHSFDRFRRGRAPAIMRITAGPYTLNARPEGTMTQSLEEHHERAANHFDSAAEHHRSAEKAYCAGDYKSAAYEAQCAAGHAVQAHDHADLAAMAHLEHHAMHAHAAKKNHGAVR